MESALNILIAIAGTAAVCIGYMKWEARRKSRTAILRNILDETRELKGVVSAEEKAIQESLIRSIQE